MEAGPGEARGKHRTHLLRVTTAGILTSIDIWCILSCMKTGPAHKPPVIVLRNCCEGGVALRIAEEDVADAAALFKALGDPARLQILDILSQRGGEVCACDFEGVVGVPDAETGTRPKQPTISHHLRVLRETGLIDGEKRGTWVYYTVCHARLAGALALLQALVADAGRPSEAMPRCCT